MTSAFHPSEPRQDPRPLFHTLPAAIRCAIREGTEWSDVKPAKWAETYGSSEEEFERLWKLTQTKVPPNSVDEVTGEGK